MQKQTIWFKIWIKHKYNNFKLRLPFNRSSKTHWVPVWKSVHNTEPLPSYIYWMLVDYCNVFPRSLAFMETNVIMTMYRESKNNTYKRHLKLLGYCYISHTWQALFTYRFIYRIVKFYTLWQPSFIIMQWIIFSLYILLNDSITSLNSTIALQQNQHT